MEKNIHDPYSDFRQYSLLHGLTMHHAYIEKTYVYCTIVVDSGTFCDPLGKEGVAHFVEHLIAENGKMSYPKSYLFFRDKGGRVQFGITSFDRTSYSFKLPAKPDLFRKGLDIFFSMLFNVSNVKKFDEQKKIIIQEYHRKFKNTTDIETVYDLRGKVYGKKTLFARSISALGNIDSIQAITREDIKMFAKDHYVPNNISLFVYGGLDVDTVIPIINDLSEQYCRPIAHMPKPSSFGKIIQPRFGYGKTLAIESKRAQSEYLGVAILPYTTNNLLVSVLTTMLSEKLFQKAIIGKSNITYSIGASSFKNKKVFAIETVCDSFNSSHRDKIIDMFYRCVRETTGNSGAFKRVVKTKIHDLMYLDSPNKDILECVVDDVMNFGRVIPIAEMIENYKSLTIEQLNDLVFFLDRENMVHSVKG